MMSNEELIKRVEARHRGWLIDHNHLTYDEVDLGKSTVENGVVILRNAEGLVLDRTRYDPVSDRITKVFRVAVATATDTTSRKESTSTVQVMGEVNGEMIQMRKVDGYLMIGFKFCGTAIAIPQDKVKKVFKEMKDLGDSYIR